MKPGTTEYVNAHQYVRKVRGVPDHCVACGTDEDRRYEWANRTGDYADPDDYQPMCVPCHRSMDRRRRHDEREDHAYSGRVRCAECRRRLKKRLYHSETPEQRARRRELNREAVRAYRARKKEVVPL